MAEEPVKLTDEEQAIIDKYLASLETDPKGPPKEGEPKEPSKSEKRFQTLANERNGLRELADSQKQIIDQMKADDNAKATQAKLDSGDFKGVINTYKSQIEALEAERDGYKLDLMRYKIGIEEGLPHAIAEIIRGGDTREGIQASAIKLKGELPQPAGGFSDGRQTGTPPSVTKGNGQPAGRYEAVSVEVL